MSNEYSAPAVVLACVGGIRTIARSLTARSFFVATGRSPAHTAFPTRTIIDTTANPENRTQFRIKFRIIAEPPLSVSRHGEATRSLRPGTVWCDEPARFSLVLLSLPQLPRTQVLGNAQGECCVAPR